MALVRRSRSGIRLGFAACVGATVFLLVACSPTLKEIDQAKSLQNKSRFEDLSRLEITCSADDDGCNQLHLLKGDACFRLAKQAVDNGKKRSDLDCAVTHLSTGIDMTKDWSQAEISRTDMYENLCESARLRADFGERQRFENVLASCAHDLAGVAPDSPGAIYFESRADYYRLTRSGNACSDWRALDARLATAAQRFRSDPRYGAALAALKATVGNDLGRNCGH